MPFLLPRLDRICGHSYLLDRLPANAVIVDLGMNQGGFSLAIRARRPRARIFGCEPLPELWRQLRSKFGSAVANVAVGAHTGGGAIAVFKSHCASVVYHRLEAEPDVLPVRIVTLDDFVRSLSLTRIDLLKVDIEGAEIGVLQNASPEVLSMCDQICVEFHDFLDPASITDIRCAIRRLRLLGFGAFRCSVLNRSDILFVHRRLIESRVAKILLWMAIVRALMTGEKARSFAHHVRIWMAGGLAARAR